jgi:MOSC domain-containing protein YiiM
MGSPSRYITSLYSRPEKSLPPQKTNELTLVAGMGINNDCHADTLSPRQVLITAADTYSDLKIPDGSLRENIVFAGPRFDEEEYELLSGDTLCLGNDGAKLRITFPCEPCGRLNRFSPHLARDIKGQRGYLARVVGSGKIKQGDTLSITHNVYPQFSECWQARVLNIVELLPPDHFLSYTKLAHLAGIASSYCRAFPKLFSKHSYLPLDRILPTSRQPPAHLREWSGEQVFAPEPLL